MPSRALNDLAVAPHFKLNEFQCRCCCAVKLSPRLVDLLEELRARAARPLIITSGYRCASHNISVGGAPRSLHMQGRAADIAVPQSEQPPLAAAARELGFREIINGGPKNYIHLAI